MKGIPFSVGRFLLEAIARVRRIALIRGIAIVGIVWILCVVAVMVVDSRLVIFDDRIRWAMTAGVWLVALVVAIFALLVPLRRRIDFRRVAAVLDARHPENEERLTSLVELSQSDAGKAGFSASLFALLGDLAENDVGRLELKHEFPMRRALRFLAVFLALALALVLGSAISPHLIGRLFVRAVAPWSDIGNLFSDEITVKPGDLTILSGSVIHIEASRNEKNSTVHLQPSPSPFSIRLSRRRGLGWSEETSEAMSGGVYETTADLNEREWRYRVTAGHAVTRYYYVRVSQMPKYDLFTATVDYPAYTRLGTLVLSNADVGAITAIQGTRVKFDIRVSDPGTLVDFRIGKEPILEHTMVSNKTVNWSLDLVNADGFRAEKGKHPLKSVIDQPPTVLIEKPTGTLRLPPHATIPVEITATDDIAIEDAYFRVSIDGEPWARHYGTKIELANPTRNSQLATPNSTFVRTVADVDLSLYDLIFAKNIRFDVVVSDGCPPELGGPHSATSTPFTVQFAVDESNYAMQELREEVANAQRDLNEVRKRLNDAQNLARQVRDTLRREQKVSENTERESERLAHELTQAEKRIEELRDDFLADERFTPLTRPLDRMLEETLKPALEAIEQASFREREERAEAVDDVLPEMEKARQEVDDFAKQLEERAKKVDAFEKAKDLAARQEALAKAAEEITSERPLDTAKLEAWKRLEEAAMRKADELARQDPDSDFAEAKRKMETAAREMAQLKQELDEQKAEDERMKRETDTAKVAEEKAKIEARAAEAAKKRSEGQAKQTDEQRKQQDQALAAAAEAQAQAQKALDDVAATRAEVAKERRDNGTPLDQQHQSALAAKEKAAAQAAKDAAAAQKTADDLLKRADATDGTQAMQNLADKAAAASQKKPHDVERAQRAAAAQQAAAKALNEEKAVREAMAKGEKTSADLEALDRATQTAAQAAEAAFDKAEKAAAASDQLADRQLGAQDQELRQAANDQQRAASAMKQAAQKRAEEAQFRAANNQNAAEARAREAQNLERQAAEAQRSAEDRLERGEATDAVKAMQQLATTASRNARKAPQTKEKFDLAAAAQQAAAEALKNELKVREGMRKGEMTEDDLAALDEQLKEGLLQMAGQRTQSARNAAEAAVQKAREAIGSEDEPEVSRLADAALDAARDAVSSALSESKLEGDDRRASELRDAEDALDAVDAEASEADALENRILGLQQSAKEALERNDRNRAANLQKEIARAQARAADAVTGEDEAAARSAANSAQEKADEALDKAAQNWNNETRAQAVAAQQAAIDAEREAQSEARSVRAMDKLAAAEKSQSQPAQGSQSSQQSEQSEQSEQSGNDNQSASKAAEAASDAMDREVSAQAAALGMSKKRSSEQNQQGAGKGNEKDKSGGGGVSEEVKKLAKELKRNDSPDFLKSLFSRLGWFKLRGLSGNGLGTQDLKDIPPEYRDLVRRYFLKISEDNL